jgi:hypothetical protein
MSTGRHWSLLSGIDIGADGDPYLDRLRILETPWLSVYLHHIHREDREADPHDHPWAFASLVLCGSYREAVWPDKTAFGRRSVTRDRSRWSVRRTPRQAAHMITQVKGPLWTLVVTGRDHGEWGFYRDRRYVPWREYLGAAYASEFEQRKAAGRPS